MAELKPKISERVKIITKKRWHGITLKLMCSVMINTIDYKHKEDIYIDPISVDDLAFIRLKFHLNGTGHLVPQLSHKKYDEESSFDISVDVSCAEFEEEFICADDWSEYINTEVETKYDLQLADMSGIHSYVIEVKITAYDNTSDSLYVKLYKDTKLTDFRMTAPDGAVAVHKLVMGIYSAEFRKLLNEEWKEKGAGHLCIDGVTARTLKNLKKFMYLKTLPNERLQLQDLLLVGKEYLIDELKNKCIAKLAKFVTSHFDDLLAFACENHVQDLAKAIVIHAPKEFIDDNVWGLDESISKPTVKNEHGWTHDYLWTC